MPFIVKHKPSGRYIKRSSGHALTLVNKNSGSIFTDNIHKARIYRHRNHVTSSLGERVNLGDSVYVRYDQNTGKAYEVRYPNWALIVDLDVFEIIEIGIVYKKPIQETEEGDQLWR